MIKFGVWTLPVGQFPVACLKFDVNFPTVYGFKDLYYNDAALNL